jgi:hypothetical protein
MGGDIVKSMLASAALAGALAVSSAAMIPAHAQGYAPGGSYLESCGDVRVFGDSLAANCRRVDGGWDRTVLRGINSCTGDIANMNGQLTCGRGGAYEGYGSSYGPYGGYGRGPYGGYGYGWGR